MSYIAYDIVTIAELAEEVNRLIDNKNAVDKALKCLTPTEYRVIELYYFYGMRWEKVAVVANYTWRHCMRLHGQALEFQFPHPMRGATGKEIAKITKLPVSIPAPHAGCDCQSRK